MTRLFLEVNVLFGNLVQRNPGAPMSLVQNAKGVYGSPALRSMNPRLSATWA